MNKRRLIIGSAALILLVGVAAWVFGFFDRTDPAIAQLQQIGDQMWDNNLSDAQRDQLRGQFRQSLDSMSESQRRAFFDANREQWSGRMNQRMDEYFTLPKAEQQKRLDEIINRIVQSRNSRQQQSGSANGGRTASNNRGDRNRNMTDAEREERSKRRLDRSSPKQRAQFAEFRKQLDQRAAQRGVKLDDQWGGRGFRGGPRS